MPISTRCPHCAAYDSFPDADAGRSVDCPACGGAINLPAKARPVAQAKPVVAVPKAKSKSAIDLDEEDDRPRRKSKALDDSEAEEDRPRKKSKPIVDLDEDRPAKKVRRRDDDDDEDRPRRKAVKKKGGSGKLLLILGGIAFVMLAGCGGIAFFVYTKMDKAVGDVRTQLTVPTDPATNAASTPTVLSVSTRIESADPKVKANVGKLDWGDTFATASAKMGRGTDCTIGHLKECLEIAADLSAPDYVRARQILDGYAPWVAKGCAKVYSDGAKFRAILVFTSPYPSGQAEKEALLWGLLIVGEEDGRTRLKQPVVLTTDLQSDIHAKALRLKPWRDFKEIENPEPEPPPKSVPIITISVADLAAARVKDRAAADKKYAGNTVQMTAPVYVQCTGEYLALKAEANGTIIIVNIALRGNQRGAAKLLKPGDTVTVTGILNESFERSNSIVLRDGIFRKE